MLWKLGTISGQTSGLQFHYRATSDVISAAMPRHFEPLRAAHQNSETARTCVEPDARRPYW